MELSKTLKTVELIIDSVDDYNIMISTPIYADGIIKKAKDLANKVIILDILLTNIACEIKEATDLEELKKAIKEITDKNTFEQNGLYWEALKSINDGIK